MLGRIAFEFKVAFARGGGWVIAAAVAVVLVAVPIGALAVIAMGFGSQDAFASWPHLFAYVLPQAFAETILLIGGVGFIAICVGTSTAWLVSAYDFPGRKVLDWALLLPLAVPTYIVAYVYLDLLHPIGPVQSALRAILDIDSPQGLRLPDIRSMEGCILLLGFVLYPYVYLMARALFLMQSASLLEAAQTLGAGRIRTFFKVALPLAWPAIAVGTSLVMMETLNDIGASEFLGVRTMTVSIYTTWVTRSDLTGAAQIAMLMLVLVVVLVTFEQWFRRRLSHSASAQRPRPMRARRLAGGAGWTALILGTVPVLIGFLVPALHLVIAAAERIAFSGFPHALALATLNTLAISTVAAAMAVMLGLGVAYYVRTSQSNVARSTMRVSSLGYAIPGTVLAIGLLAPITATEIFVHEVAQTLFGVSTGLFILGSGIALIYAYVVRFLAIPAGGIHAGLGRLPISLDHAARTLGQTSTGALRRVHLPLIRPAIGAAAILVFVDSMKELPATLLLRPLNFETLATMLYGEAARGTYEDGAIAALMIVLAGLVPVIVLAKMSRSVDQSTASSHVYDIPKESRASSL